LKIGTESLFRKVELTKESFMSLGNMALKDY
jgi:hypothetical protein